MGFAVSKPYGDSERYDFILDSRDLTHKPRHPEERAFCATKDLGVPRDASRFLRGKNARLARIPCPPLYRVQVKCSTQLLNGLYRINAHRRITGRAVPYLPSEIDFIVAYIIPEDTWYIIPIHAVRAPSLLFRRKKDHRPGLDDQYRKPGTSSAASPSICVKRGKRTTDRVGTAHVGTGAFARPAAQVYRAAAAWMNRVPHPYPRSLRIEPALSPPKGWGF